MMKYIRYITLLLILSTGYQVVAQNDNMVSNRRERKRVWRKWNKKKDGYNPYLKKKKKNRPSAQGAKADKKEIRRQKRDYKRQLKKAKS